MTDSGVISIVVAVISALGAIGASVSGVLAAKARREHKDFREENTSQHGATLALIRDIELTTRETRQDVREMRIDVSELRSDFEEHKLLGASAHEPSPRTKETSSGTNPKAKVVKAVDETKRKPRRRAS
jgi:hypothetical protein